MLEEICAYLSEILLPSLGTSLSDDELDNLTHAIDAGIRRLAHRYAGH